jgi:CDP-glycerol glycerophosphotransferase (TagB/SpsB family)
VSRRRTATASGETNETYQRGWEAIRTVIDVALRPLLLAVYYLTGLLPRDPTLWVFGSWSGKLAGDNAGAFYRYVAGLPQGPRCVWISSDRKIVRDLRSSGFPARSRSSLAGWIACARAGVYLYDGLTSDINHWLSRGSMKVLLRHGVGMKGIERAIDTRSHHLFKLFHGKWWQRAVWAFLIPWHLPKPHWCLATSPEHAWQATRFFGIEPAQVWVTGFPRHDKMLQGGQPAGVAKTAADAMRRSARPTFLYMPTFRDQSRFGTQLWDLLNAEARRVNVELFVKLHFVDSRRGAMPSSEDRREWERITWVDPDAEPTDLYGSATGLITDYSSVAFDMMLLRKPIIYFIPDLTSFLEERSLLYPIDEVTPGPKCRSFAELGDALVAASESGIGPWRDEYEKVLERFHTYTDGESSGRVYRQLVEHIGLGLGPMGEAPTPRPISKDESQQQRRRSSEAIS